MNMIDGYNGGVAHIEADMIRDHNISLYGNGDYVLPVGNAFDHTIDSNNAVTIKDGMASVCGARVSISYGDSETVTIENGTSGYYRHDLIVIEYSRNENGVESALLKVVKGTLANSEEGATDPAVLSGDIRGGATTHQAILKRVNVNGLSIESVESVMQQRGDIAFLGEDGSLTLGGHDSPVGTTFTGDYTKASLSSGTSFVELCTNIKLPAGAWVVSASVRFPSTLNGKRCGCEWRVNESTVSSSRAYGSADSNFALHTTLLTVSENDVNIKIFGWQESGTTMKNIATYWKAIRIA